MGRPEGLRGGTSEGSEGGRPTGRTSVDPEEVLSLRSEGPTHRNSIQIVDDLLHLTSRCRMEVWTFLNEETF